MAEITPEERVQKIKANLLEDLDFEPEKIRNFYTTTMFGRALSHIVGWTGKKALMLRCTSGGELKTAPTTTGIEFYQVASGNAADTLTTWRNWQRNVSRLDIFIWDNPAMVQVLLAGGSTGPAFEVPPGFYSVDCRHAIVYGWNKTAGQTARYQVIGWW